MQIVIDIPEENYERMKFMWKMGSLNPYLKAIAIGTPLPKGHGRLIDADTLAKRMSEYGWHHPDSTIHEFVEDDLPTIIEADKEEQRNDD